MGAALPRPRSPRYDEARDRGYLAVDAAGEVVHVEHTPTPDGRPRAMLDVFDPEALAWWQGLHEPFLDDGVAVFKTDFGEALPDTCVPSDGTPPGHAHNLYPLRYNGAVSDASAPPRRARPGVGAQRLGRVAALPGPVGR